MQKCKGNGLTTAEIFFVSQVNTGILLVGKDGRIFNRKTNRYIGAVGSGGYPKISMMRCKIDGKKYIEHIQIHRLVWLVYKGDMSEELQINHKNGNKLDPRLTNLELITKSENSKHAYVTGLMKFGGGEHNGNAKLTKIQVLQMRRLCPLGLIDLITSANNVGVHKNTLWSALVGKTYKTVDENVSPVKMLSRRQLMARRRMAMGVLKNNSVDRAALMLNIPVTLARKLQNKYTPNSTGTVSWQSRSPTSSQH